MISYKLYSDEWNILNAQIQYFFNHLKDINNQFKKELINAIQSLFNTEINLDVHFDLIYRDRFFYIDENRYNQFILKISEDDDVRQSIDNSLSHSGFKIMFNSQCEQTIKNILNFFLEGNDTNISKLILSFLVFRKCTLCDQLNLLNF